METRRASRPVLVDHRLWLLLEVAVLYWLLDAALQALIFREGSFVQQTLFPDPRDLLGRLLVVCLVTLFGVYTIAALGKAKQAVRGAQLATAEAVQILNSLPQAICAIGKDGTVRRVNDAFAALFAIGKEEASERKCSQVLGAQMAGTTRSLLRRVLAGEERVERECEIELGEAARARYRVAATPLRNAQGKCIGMIQSFAEIADRDRLPDLRQGLSEMAAFLTQAIPLGLLVCKYEPPGTLRLVDGNPAAELLCETRIDEWRSRELADIWPWASEAGLLGALVDVLTTGEPFQADSLPCGAEPGRRPLQVRAFRIPQNRVGLVLDEIREQNGEKQRLEASLKEKEALLDKIRDRQKDDLQVIFNLLELQCEMTRDERTLRTLKDCQGRVAAITLVYQRLGASQGWDEIDFAGYVRKLLARLLRTYDSGLGLITSRVSVEEASMGAHAAVPCGLIINELVSNSLKHAFPQGRAGEIRVEVSRGAQGECGLIVSDNGVGLPQDLDFRRTETLGLQLVNLLVDQLDGAIELDRTHGTTFRITLFGVLPRQAPLTPPLA